MIDSTRIKAHRSAAGGKGEQKAVGRLRGRCNTKNHALAGAKGRLDRHPVDRRRSARLPPCRSPSATRPTTAPNCAATSMSMLATRIPNKSDTKQPFSFNNRPYKLLRRIESAFNRLKETSGALPSVMTSSRATTWPLSAWLLRLYGITSIVLVLGIFIDTGFAIKIRRASLLCFSFRGPMSRLGFGRNIVR
jgi:hypothetical protein